MSESKVDNTQEFSVILSLDLDNILLDSANISELYFIEDIYSFSITGKLVFTDNKGVLEFGPLTGNETLTVIYGEEQETQRTFDIYKINKIDQASQISPGTSSVIELFFVDRSFFLLHSIRYSLAGKNTKISDIVKEIGEKMLNIQTGNKFENTRETLDHFYMPYGTPRTTLMGLMKRASGSVSKQAGYCLYNNSQGSNFITLDKLLSQDNKMKIGDSDSGEYVFEDTTPFLYNRILQGSISGLDNNQLTKLAGGNMLGYDSMRKKFITKEYTYSDSISKQTVLGNSSLFFDISENRVKYERTAERDVKRLDNMFNYEGNKRYAIQQVVSLIVRGHENRFAGGLISVIGPSRNSTEIYNENLDGLYLVKSITHQFSGGQQPHYRQKLVCIKNGYQETQNSNLMKSTKKNLE